MQYVWLLKNKLRKLELFKSKKVLINRYNNFEIILNREAGRRLKNTLKIILYDL